MSFVVAGYDTTSGSNAEDKFKTYLSKNSENIGAKALAYKL